MRESIKVTINRDTPPRSRRRSRSRSPPPPRRRRSREERGGGGGKKRRSATPEGRADRLGLSLLRMSGTTAESAQPQKRISVKDRLGPIPTKRNSRSPTPSKKKR